MSELSQPLKILAELVGIQIGYRDVFGVRRTASLTAVHRILNSMGLPLREDQSNAGELLDEILKVRALRPIEPVMVFRPGQSAKIIVKIPEKDRSKTGEARIRFESGGEVSFPVDFSKLRSVGVTKESGVPSLLYDMSLETRLPDGYHRFELEIAGVFHHSTLIVAPEKAFGFEGVRSWGVFLPIHGLHSDRTMGSGDFTDFRKLVDTVRPHGGEFVGTLPMLTTFLGKPFSEWSPYSPASRLYWNELFVDPTRAPGFESCAEAKELLNSDAFRRAVTELGSDRYVDYEESMRLRRQLLERLARQHQTLPESARAPMLEYIERHPDLKNYAAFRATCESTGRRWKEWDSRQREGILNPGDYAADDYYLYLYMQWLAHEEMRSLSGLYLDLPLGVHSDGYDTWREQGLFVEGMSVGAPPDGMFVKGQDWGFPPLHPERIRESGYRYFIEVVRHHMAHAGVLRIDHVMGLHRKFWVPHGLGATEGVYVRYPVDELYAILCIESHRNRCKIIGEDLGTVPDEVHRDMARHGFRRMHVVEYELAGAPDGKLGDAPINSLASLNTHDMPMFASYWKGLDIDDRVKLGLLTDEEAAKEVEARARQREGMIANLRKEGWLDEGRDSLKDVTRAWLRKLAAGPAETLLVNLEDLWFEEEPVNIPGTWRERPNWRRKSAWSLEKIAQDPFLNEVFQEIDRLRKSHHSKDRN